jgi:hypothetical protein
MSEPDLTQVRRRAEMWLLLAASLAATIPVWIPTFPPMTDLPQHASQVALLRGMLTPDFPYESVFQVNWFTPYLLGYLLTFALMPLVGIVVACKVVVSLALASTPLATALVMTETGTDRRFALLAIPAMYGFSFQWGFLNFLVAGPLGLAFVWLALRQAKRPTRVGGVALGVAILLLFFCHALICLFFGSIAGGILLAGGDTLRTRIARLLPLAAVVPVMVVWGFGAMTSPVAQRPIDWDLNWLTTHDAYYTRLADWATTDGWGWGRLAGILPRLLGVRPGLLSTLVGLSLFLLPLAAGARFSRRPVVWVPFALCMVTLLVLPATLFGINLTFQRFTGFLLPLYLITLRQAPDRQRPRWTWPACALLSAGWIAVVAFHTVQYERDAAGFDEVLARMEPGERALTFAFERDSDGAIAPPFLHYPAWYSALKQGVVDPSVAGSHVQLVLYRPERQPLARLEGFEWEPGMFDWQLFGGAEYRYFVVKARGDLSGWMFRDATCTTRLLHHVNQWWVYESGPECASRRQ